MRYTKKDYLNNVYTHNEAEHPNTTNDFQLNIPINNSQANCEIKVRLNDDCGNGHEDFAITAYFWTVGKERTDRNWEMGGCCHDEILKIRPDLAPFVALHLSDSLGAPMYAVENGFYHLRNSEKGVFMSYMRLKDENEFQYFNAAEDKAHFWYLLTKSKVPARWKKEAKGAISLLEKMIGTGEKFLSRATKENFSPMPKGEQKAIEALLKEGYYTDEARDERAKQKAIDIINKHMDELTAELNEKVRKAEIDFELSVAMVPFVGTSNNWIYYNHTKTLKLNWNTTQWKPAIDEDVCKAIKEHFESTFDYVESVVW